MLTGKPLAAGKSFTEVFLRLASPRTFELRIWTRIAPAASKNERGITPIFAERSNWSGRQVPRTKAMPDAAPMRTAC